MDYGREYKKAGGQGIGVSVILLEQLRYSVE